ncbi:unnamed protein product [Phaedon cochleariae]|uniref:Uncharacterized protein n=1 Tax=Phaedon cochleariae TaxID=80249 RepID=A0A9N9X489_PHACE|nr:unnamed protein product [Phaedon cochleariae]
MDMTSFFPKPKKQNVVSQPLKAWMKRNSSDGFKEDSEEAMLEYMASDASPLPHSFHKICQHDEPFVAGSDLLVEAGYSYWTLGYALSLSGAKKLLEGDPLTRLVPVDEYLPILFDKHPQENWKGHYPRRDLVALSAAPLLLYPTHYTGDAGYVSDTEDSVLVPDVLAAREDL